MDEMMTFPDTWEEFEKSYGFTDNEEVYTNGARLIPSFRVKQWLDHLPSVKPTRKTPSNTLGALDCVERQAAIDAIERNAYRHTYIDQIVDIINDLPSVQTDVPDTNVGDLISRQAAIDAICTEGTRLERNGTVAMAEIKQWCVDILEEVPSVQLDRDIPMKPNETTDRTWGIPKKQAVCPKCEYYLGHVSFLGEYKGKRITYCETCGQAIDWEGWDSDD